MSDVAVALDLIRRIASTDERERERAADEVTDVMRGLGPVASVVAGALAVARLGETDRAAQEAQLHALAEMAEWNMVPASVRELIVSIDMRDLDDPSQVEYLEYLRESING